MSLNSTLSFASKLDSGSSKHKILGFNTKALAIATLCCCPPESSETLLKKMMEESYQK